MYDTNTTYYIPSKFIMTEGGEATSPYGKLNEAYVGVVYDGKGYKYYWTSRDESGQGFNKIVSNDALEENLIKSDIESEYVNDLVQKSAIGCNKNIKILNENGTWDDYLASEFVIDDDNFKNGNSCPNCVFSRPDRKSISEGKELKVPTVNDYKELENYSSVPFFGITLNGNIVDKLYICLVAGENLVCLEGIYEGKQFECQMNKLAKGLGIEEIFQSSEDFYNNTDACIKTYYQYPGDDSEIPGISCKSGTYGFTASYSKNKVINFFSSGKYLCLLQLSTNSSSPDEWGVCEQH